MSGSIKMTKLDFLTMKSQFESYLSLVLIVLLFGVMGSSITLKCITAAWFVALQSSNIFALQEKNNLDRLYGSVSVTLRGIVIGRYAFVFLNYLFSYIVVLLLYAIFALFEGTAWGVYDALLGFSLSFLVFSLIVGMQMPMYFKLGYTRAKIWSMVPFMAVMAMIALPALVPAISGWIIRTLPGVIAYWESHSGIVMFGIILASCLIQVFSCLLSMAAYRKRR